MPVDCDISISKYRCLGLSGYPASSLSCLFFYYACIWLFVQCSLLFLTVPPLCLSWVFFYCPLLYMTVSLRLLVLLDCFLMVRFLAWVFLYSSFPYLTVLCCSVESVLGKNRFWLASCVLLTTVSATVPKFRLRPYTVQGNIEPQAIDSISLFRRTLCGIWRPGVNSAN